MDELAAAHWDQDDPYEFPGSHVMLHGGNKHLVDHLAKDVKVSYGVRAIRVRHDEDSCSVECDDGDVLSGDAVICTLPLGVLQRNEVAFDPPLPDDKCRAIRRLGYGLLNKVMLAFDIQFWDHGVQTFGYCTGEERHRGESFLFYVYSGAAQGNVLIALVSGDAAFAHEQRTDEECVERTLGVLRCIFHKKERSVPDPIDSFVTRWQADECAGLGSYSFIPVGASGEEYTTLGEPVGERLHFAGEATTRLHPATMHGAFCTGRLVASRLDMILKRKGREERLKVMRKDESKQQQPDWAHRWAPVAQRLEAIFDQPEMTFGAQFAAIFDPRPPGEDGELQAPALLRLEFVLDRKKKRRQPVYLQLTRGEVLNLLSQRSDHRRLVTLRDKIVRRSGLDYAGINVLMEVEKQRGLRVDTEDHERSKLATAKEVREI